HTVENPSPKRCQNSSQHQEGSGQSHAFVRGHLTSPKPENCNAVTATTGAGASNRNFLGHQTFPLPPQQQQKPQQQSSPLFLTQIQIPTPKIPAIVQPIDEKTLSLTASEDLGEKEFLRDFCWDVTKVSIFRS